MPLCFRICSENKKRLWSIHGMLSVTFNLVHVSAIVSARSNFLRLFQQEAYTLHIHTTPRRQESHPLCCQTHRVRKNGAHAGECPCQGHQECDVPISDIVTWKHTDDTHGQLWADNNREKIRYLTWILRKHGPENSADWLRKRKVRWVRTFHTGNTHIWSAEWPVENTHPSNGKGPKDAQRWVPCSKGLKSLPWQAWLHLSISTKVWLVVLASCALP